MILTKPPFPSVVDSTMLSTFKACPRHFFYSYLHHLKPIEISIDLRAGGSFARGLEVLRKCIYNSGMEVSLAIHTAQLEMIRHWGDEDMRLDHKKNLPNLLLALEDYVTHFGTKTDPVQPYIKGDGTAAVEFSFTMDIDKTNPSTGEPILYSGRFDMLGVFNGALFVVDEKSTVALGPSWAKQWDLRSQFIGYCCAAQQYGYPVAGAIIRGVGLMKDRTEFTSVITYHNDYLIERWWKTTRYYLDMMIQCYNSGYWPENLDTACNTYSGCPFRKVCDKRHPEEWLDTQYIVSPWNPLHTTP